MADYRIYRLDASGHIVWAQDACCATDDEALAAATRELKAAQQVEVWTGARRVGQVSGTSRAIG
jgi:hypothetical protein